MALTALIIFRRYWIELSSGDNGRAENKTGLREFDLASSVTDF